MTFLYLSHAFFIIRNKFAFLHSSFISIGFEIWPLLRNRKSRNEEVSFLQTEVMHTVLSVPITQTQLRYFRNMCLPDAVKCLKLPPKPRCYYILMFTNSSFSTPSKSNQILK